MKVFVTAMLLVLSLSVHAQIEDTTMVSIPDTITSIMAHPTFDYKNTALWQRNRAKKFAAYSCIGTGTASLALGGLMYVIVKAFSGGNGEMGVVGGLWAGASVATIGASVPLFISAGHDRKKARTLTWDEYQADNHSSRNYRRTGFRVEPSVGFTLPIYSDAGKLTPGYAFGVEGRSYLGSSDFDIAFRFGFDKTNVYERYYDDLYNDNYELTDRQVALRFSVVSDYNFMKDQMVNPFVGMGVGVSLPAAYNLEPRAGIELYHHHRLTLTGHFALGGPNFDIDAKHTSNLCFTYGYSF